VGVSRVIIEYYGSAKLKLKLRPQGSIVFSMVDNVCSLLVLTGVKYNLNQVDEIYWYINGIRQYSDILYQVSHHTALVYYNGNVFGMV